MARIYIITFVFWATATFLSPIAAGGERNLVLLDGMVFVGQMGEIGQTDIADELHFRDGKFWSTFCVEFGLPPGNYTAQRIDDRIVFHGVLAGKPGKFVYDGIVVDGKVIAQINWTKARWYWTIERDLEFAGSTKGNDQKNRK